MHLSTTVFGLVTLQAAAVAGLAVEHLGLDARGEDLAARGNVGACQAILVALKASKFCSSFVPITDKTTTVTHTASAVSTKVTVTAQCTNDAVQVSVKKRVAPSTTPAAPSTVS